MSVQVHCPECNAGQTVQKPGDFRPFYVNCTACAKRFIAEPVQSGMVVYRDGEAPCCSDPDCRETEMASSGQD